MTKRSNGEGTLDQRPDGRWRARIRYEDPVTGDYKRATFYGRTKTEARQKMKAAIARIEAGSPVKDATQTVADWLKHWREATLEASDRKATTKANYATMSRCHIEPAPFGAIQLARLRPSDVDRLLLSLRSAKLADATVARVFNVLRLALNDAVRDGLVARNPTEGMRQPRVRRKEATFLSAEETRRVIAAAAGSRYEPVMAMIAALGLRRGEALALKWSEVDLDKSTARVIGTLSRMEGELVVTEPKTEKSRRVLALSPAMVRRLKAHKRQQTQDRLAAGNLWRDTGLVFTTEFGGPLEPGNVLRAVKGAADKANVPHATVHTLRHSAATALLENGVNLKAVSELLGHADIRITADVYGHVTEDAARQAMTTLSDVLGL